tara:strand:+ start:6210 stop:7343 length:1134 start_codon:yes stop_codon:yes gene_type:complete
MASRYLKIPVVQRVSTTIEGAPGEEQVGSYSKILKTLRIPQEFLGTSTGSLYFSGELSSNNAQALKLNDIALDEQKKWTDLYFGIAPTSQDDTGFWMQIPLNVSKTLWQSTTVSPVGGDDFDNYLEYNGSLWLRISQEVVWENADAKGGATPSRVWYTYPFLSDLFKENNSAYELRVNNSVAYVGNQGYNQIQKFLQDKLQKALVSNPGAKETLLDFGKTEENLDAGQWECKDAATLVAEGLDPNDVVLVTQQYPEDGREFINGVCKLVVTCAVITNRGQGVGSVDAVDAIQSYPTLAETWGYGDKLYDDSHNGALANSVDVASQAGVVQEINLNPAQLFSDGVTTYQQFTGKDDFTSKTIDDKCCEGFASGPIKGK